MKYLVVGSEGPGCELSEERECHDLFSPKILEVFMKYARIVVASEPTGNVVYGQTPHYKLSAVVVSTGTD